jgi:tetratricopeptide (TPR) repeat protein
MRTVLIAFAFVASLGWVSLGSAQQAPEPSVSQTIAQSDEALEQRDVNKAVALVSQALSRHPGDERLLLEQARILVYQKRDREAIEKVNAVLSKNPGSRDAKLTLAQIYGYREDYKKSNALYRELLVASPGDEAAAVGLIHNLVLQDKRQQARDELQKALQLHPNSLRLQQYNDYLQPGAAAGRESAPELFHRVQAGETFFSDNAGNRALYLSQGFTYDLGRNITSRFRMDESSLWKTGSQTLTVLSGAEELRVRPNKYFAVRGSGGFVRFADNTNEPTYSGDVDLYPARGLLLSGGYSRFPILPTFDAVQFDLLAGGWHGRADYRLHGFSFNGSVYFTHYTDGNDAEREYGELMKWFGSGTLSFGGGYAFRHIHFDQPLAHGYFSPDQYWSHLGEAGVRVRAGRIYRGEVVGYFGGERQDLGTYTPAGEVLVRNEFLIRQWELNLNYSHFHLAQATGAFHADMVSGAVGFRF